MAGRPKYSRGLYKPNAPRGTFTGDVKKTPSEQPPLTQSLVFYCKVKYEYEMQVLGLQILAPNHPEIDSLLETRMQRIRIVQLFKSLYYLQTTTRTSTYLTLTYGQS
jgi:hypothetical protein